MTVKAIDLFSGAGGLSLGLKRALKGEASDLVAIDNDVAANRTFAANFSAAVMTADIERWADSNLVPNADLVFGGPPCQGFSTLNKGCSEDSRRRLWEPFLETVRKSGARCFVMENVMTLLRSQELKDFRSRAGALGYNTICRVLNSADYGVPQVRKRTFVIGWKGEAKEGLEFPDPTHAKVRDEGSERKPWVTVREAISDLPTRPIGTEIGREATLDLHFGRNLTDLSERRYRLIPPVGNRFDLEATAPELTPDCWKRKKSGGTDLFGRLWWDRPSVTIRTEFFKPEKGRYLHPSEHRPITHREAARLMGFPDDFRFVGSKTQIARQIGNAVPPPLSNAIFIPVLKWLRGGE